MRAHQAISLSAPRRVSLPFDTAILAGQLRESSRAMYARDIAAYLDFAGSAEAALDAATFARWRAALADDSHEYSPNTTFDFNQDLMLNEAIHAILFEGKVAPNAKNIPFMWPRYRDEVCERRSITGVEKDAVAELDRLRMFPPLVPSPYVAYPTASALDALSPERKEELAGILARMSADWMNKKNDALGLYNHLTHALRTSVPQHAVFVTSDQNFKDYRAIFKKTNWEVLQSLGFPGHIMEPEEAVTYFRSLSAAERTA